MPISVFSVIPMLRIWTKKEAYVKRNGTGLGGIRNADTRSLAVCAEVDFCSYTVDKTILSLCMGKGQVAPSTILRINRQELLEKLKTDR